MLDFFHYITRYFHTIRYLKFTQILARLTKGFKFRISVNQLSLKLDLPGGNWIQPIRHNQSLIGPNKFSFLNENQEVLSKEDWNNEKWSKLWLYNLHYFDDLNAIGNYSRKGWHHSIIERWIDENPPGTGNGWEPYPISLRIVNWAKYFFETGQFKDSWTQSLALQAHYLSKNIETHILGNHLIANAKALIFAGLIFKGDKAKRWLFTGEKILKRECSEQILEDGGHFELSPMYHSIVLEDLLDLFNLYGAYNHERPSYIEKHILIMFDWLATMTHPDGKISFFNDATFSIAPPLEQLTAYSKRNALLVSESDDIPLKTLKYSGYSRIDIDASIILIDHAKTGPDYLGGHSHADTLSFELSLFNHRVIVNSGISLYGGLLASHLSDPERQRQRGTAVHSTVTIDRMDSSEVWGAFRLARRASILSFHSSVNKSNIIVSASHNGYQRLSGEPIHTREWKYSDRSLLITDNITGSGRHNMEAIFPFHPDVELINIEEKKLICGIFGNKFRMEFDGVGNFILKESTYHPKYGVSIDNKHLIYQSICQLPFKLKTRILW